MRKLVVIMWVYSPRKNMPNIPTTSSAWTALAPETLRERNRRSGISGFSIRAWRTRKATIAATATAPRVSVRAEPQPCCSTCRIV